MTDIMVGITTATIIETVGILTETAVMIVALIMMTGTKDISPVPIDSVGARAQYGALGRHLPAAKIKYSSKAAHQVLLSNIAGRFKCLRSGLLFICVVGCVFGCSQPVAGATQVLKAAEGPSQVAEAPYFVETGLASWYGRAHQGKLTADGEHFDQWALTAANPTLPFGTVVRVTSLKSGKTVSVRINDRGPKVRGRVIDVSRAAAAMLKMVDRGVTEVRIEAFLDDQVKRVAPREES